MAAAAAAAAAAAVGVGVGVGVTKQEDRAWHYDTLYTFVTCLLAGS